MENLQFNTSQPVTPKSLAKQAESSNYASIDNFNSLVFSCQNKKRDLIGMYLQVKDKRCEKSSKQKYQELLSYKATLLSMQTENKNNEVDMEDILNRTLSNMMQKETIRRGFLQEKIDSVKAELEGFNKIKDKGEYIRKYAQLDQASTLETKNQILNQAAKSNKIIEAKLAHKQHYADYLKKKVIQQTNSIEQHKNLHTYQKDCTKKLLERINWLKEKNNKYIAVCESLKGKIDEWNCKMQQFLTEHNATNIEEARERQELVKKSEEDQIRKAEYYLQEIGKLRSRLKPIQEQPAEQVIRLRDYQIVTENEIQQIYEQLLLKEANMASLKLKVTQKVDFVKKIYYAIENIHVSWKCMDISNCNSLTRPQACRQYNPNSTEGVGLLFNSIKYLIDNLTWATVFLYTSKFKVKVEVSELIDVHSEKLESTLAEAIKILKILKEKSETNIESMVASKESKKRITFFANEKINTLPNLKDAIVQQDSFATKETLNEKVKETNNPSYLRDEPILAATITQKKACAEKISKEYNEFYSQPPKDEVWKDIKLSYNQLTGKVLQQQNVKEEDQVINRGEVLNSIYSFSKHVDNETKPKDFIRQLYVIKKNSQEVLRRAELASIPTESDYSDMKMRIDALINIKNISQSRKLHSRISSLPKLRKSPSRMSSRLSEFRQREFINSAMSFRKGLASFGVNLKKKPGKLAAMASDQNEG